MLACSCLVNISQLLATCSKGVSLSWAHFLFRPESVSCGHDIATACSQTEGNAVDACVELCAFVASFWGVEFFLLPSYGSQTLPP